MASNVVHNSSAKYELARFDGEIDFSHWKTKMHMFLVLQGLWKIVEEKVCGNLDGSMVELKEKAPSFIFLSAKDNVLCEIATVTSAVEA